MDMVPLSEDDADTSMFGKVIGLNLVRDENSEVIFVFTLYFNHSYYKEWGNVCV